MKIYTKTGDTGTTSLVGGQRIEKDAKRLECYGTVDELNAQIGQIRSFLIHWKSQSNFTQSSEELDLQLRAIQNYLFSIGSHLATATEAAAQNLPELSENPIESLERWMDSFQERLPELREFILPSGGPVGSSCHLARTVCRRAERVVAGLAKSEAVNPLILSYLNRLSDYFFVLARISNHQQGITELTWQK